MIMSMAPLIHVQLQMGFLARQISGFRYPVYDVLSNRCHEYECLTWSLSIAAPPITHIALHN